MRLWTILPEPRRGSERGYSEIGGRVPRADARPFIDILSRAGLRCETVLARKPLTEVWRARLGDGRACIVKCAAAAYAGDRGVARLIEREWALLRAAAGPGVVEAFALERTERGPALVCEYLPNGDLVPLAGAHPRHWAGALRELAGTLQALHRKGLVHRDVKPRNVLFDAVERATLIDFASAAHCGARPPESGTTRAYRAPTAEADTVVAPIEDVHAFAAVAYELMAGRPPFEGAGSAEGRDGFVPLAAADCAGAEEPAVQGLAAIVDAVLAGGDAKEPTRSLAVLQTALDAIIDNAERRDNE